LRAKIYKNDKVNPIKIFISYARKQEYIAESIVSSLTAIGHECRWDGQVQFGDQYFEIIDNLMKESDVSIVILTKDSMESTPVMREIGMLMGLKKEIILYTPLQQSINNIDLPAMLRKYVQCDTKESLLEEVSTHSRFNNIFVHETEAIKLDTFRRHFGKNTDICKLELRIPIMDDRSIIQFGHVKDSIRFGCILVLLAKNSGPSKHIEMCPTEKTVRDGIHRDQCAVEQDRMCAIFTNPKCSENPETVLLNKIIDCSLSEFDKSGQTYIVEYVLPVHRQYGLTFKCFVDVANLSLVDTVMELLKRKFGEANVSRSGSFESGRIYLLLPENPVNHLLNIRIPDSGPDISEEDAIKNNYLCPSCLKLRRNLTQKRM